MTMLIDQATQLRSLVREGRDPAEGREVRAPAAGPRGKKTGRSSGQRRRRANVIAITSGKGGVGKSNVAVNLAIRLAAAGKRVVLLDADLGLANVDVLCNVDLTANLSHVIARNKELREVMVDAPGGFRLIGGASGLARMADLSDADRQRLVEALAELEQTADIILIDTGAGISPNVLTFTRAADHVLVVTTPEPTAIADAYAVVKVISRRSGASGAPAGPGAAAPHDRRVSLLVNQVRTAGEARVVYDRIAKVARQFLGVTVHDAGFIPSDDRVRSAVRRRTPFLLADPTSAASQSITRLAERLVPGTVAKVETAAPAAAPAAEADEPEGFFQRLGRWLRRGSAEA